MADSQVWTIPGKADSAPNVDRKISESISLAKRLKKLLGIPERSDPANNNEPYFGL